MTATLGGPEPGTSGEQEPAVAAAASLCDQARDLAQNGHLKRAAQVYEQALERGGAASRARAAQGLAVVRLDLGEVAAARRADELAIDTGHPEFAPRAAHHLALSCEAEENFSQARAAWRTVLDLGNRRYILSAHYGLARIAERGGDHAGAREHWEAVLDTAGPAAQGNSGQESAELLAAAAQDYAQRLLARGDVEGAAEAVRRGRALGSAVPQASALGLVSAAVHTERAIAELGAVLDAEAGDPESGGVPDPEERAAAVELLARLLALRGDSEAAEEVWQHGATHPDPALAAGVWDRLRRGFLVPEDPDAPEETEQPWWDGFVAAAVAQDNLPLLAGELFAALTQIHARLASAHGTGESAVPAGELRAAVVDSLRLPSEYVWGEALHEDLRERLRRATGGAQVLPQDWPDTP